jgi:transposase InsO family protein
MLLASSPRATTNIQVLERLPKKIAVEKMCQVFTVSRSSYYKWLNRKPSKRSLEVLVLKEAIKKMNAETKFRLGSPKITVELRDQRLFVSRVRVARLIKLMGIRSIITKKFRVSTTDSNHSYVLSDYLLDRDFTAPAPAEKWVSDITYVRTKQGWFYLTVVMDLFDRKIIGWSMSDSLAAKTTVIGALNMALRSRPIHPNKLIFHSDRGAQYAWNDFRKILAKNFIKQNMSRRANCWDNAAAESFFKILKSELIYQIPELNGDQMKILIFEFVEIWYNKRRKHSYLNFLTPEDFGKRARLLVA